MLNEKCSSDFTLTFLIVFFFSLAAFLLLYPSTPAVKPAMGAALYQRSIVAQDAGHLHRALRYVNLAVEHDPRGQGVGLYRMAHQVVLLEADIRAKKRLTTEKRALQIGKEGFLAYYWTSTPWDIKILQVFMIVVFTWFAFRLHHRATHGWE